MIQRHVIGPTRVKGQHKFDWVGDGGFGLIERERKEWEEASRKATIIPGTQ